MCPADDLRQLPRVETSDVQHLRIPISFLDIEETRSRGHATVLDPYSSQPACEKRLDRNNSAGLRKQLRIGCTYRHEFEHGKHRVVSAARHFVKSVTKRGANVLQSCLTTLIEPCKDRRQRLVAIIQQNTVV